MKKSLFDKRYGFLTKSRSMWIGLSAVLLLSNILLSLSLIFKQEKVIVIPPGLKESIWIESNQVDPTYLEEMASYFLHLALDTSPMNAGYQHKTLLKHASPDKYGSLKIQLMKEAERLKKDNVSTLFSPRILKVMKDGKTVKVEGSLATFVGNKRISEESKTFVLKVKIIKGRVYLDELSREGKDETD